MAEKPQQPQLLDGELEFTYEKSAFFRVIHVDGAVGGVSAGNKTIHMAVYSERQPIPKRMVHLVKQGVLGKEISEKRESRKGIFREVESDLVMSVATATAIRNWLNERIAEVEAIAKAEVGEEAPR